MKLKLPKSITTVTTFSKFLAGSLFVLLPFVGFALGMQYQRRITQMGNPKESLLREQVQTENKSSESEAFFKNADKGVPITSNWKTFSSEKGWSFQYPTTWQFSQQTIPSNQSIKDPNRMQYSSGSEETELIKLTNNGWEIRIYATNQKPDPILNEEGRGMALYDFNNERIKPLLISGKKAFRMNLEEGVGWSVPEGSNPFYQPIFFYLRDLDLPGVEAIGEYGWTMLDYKKPLQISIEYYSPQFTNEIIERKEMDSQMLRQMDTIIQSITADSK